MSTQGSEPLIEFRRVKLRFGPNCLYDDLSLQVQRGETLTILGASGSGKSVMLKLLIGLLKPDSGSIYFGGRDLVPLSEQQLLPVRRRISMLFQGGALFDSLTVGDNIAYPLREHLQLAEREVEARVAEKLALVGLAGIEKMVPADLSGGMRKRVAIARAIAADPEVLLYDEPTTGLDPVNTRRINELILSIQQRLRVTSLVVTHDLASAFMVSDRLAMLSEHRILATLPCAEFQRSQQAAIREFVTAMPTATPAQEARSAPGQGARP